MNVYQLNADINRVRNLMTSELDRLDEVDGRTIQVGWRPIVARLEDKGRPEGDVFDLALGGYPVFTSRAREVLAPLFDANGEWLAIDCAGRELWLFNTTRILDALDEERSDCFRFDDGRIVKIHKHVFLQEMLPGAIIFRLKSRPSGMPYVTEVVRERIEQAKLKGFDLRQVYPSADTGARTQPMVVSSKVVSDQPLPAKEQALLDELEAAARDALGQPMERGLATVEALAQRIDAARAAAAPPEDLTELWGALYGAEVAAATGWTWRYLKWKGGREASALVSPDRAHCCVPLQMVGDLLNDAHRENTLVLVYNMLRDGALPASGKGSYMELS